MNEKTIIENETKKRRFDVNKNILKVRDDRYPIYLTLEQGENEVVFSTSNSVNWCSNPAHITQDELRSRIEPWLTALFQSDHLSLLVGSGLSCAVTIKATGSAGADMSMPDIRSIYNEQIKNNANESARKAERGDANIEDFIRVINELLRGLDILGKTEEYEALHEELQRILNQFSESITDMEYSIANAKEDKRNEAFNQLVMFLLSFASRTGTRDRLNIFTTNYDRLIEAAADIAGLHLIDRFVGYLMPIFRSSKLDIDMHYNSPGTNNDPRYLEGVVRYTKLHGSIDWINIDGTVRRLGVPFGAKSIKPFLEVASVDKDVSSLMIYPNSSKDRETSEYPYVELFRDCAAAMCRPNHTLVVYGYGFGDDHINRIIADMLTIPSTHLVILAFDDSTGRIMKFYESTGRINQISLIIGHDIANLDALVDYYLPKPAIDRTTMRMTEMLKERLSSSDNFNNKENSEDGKSNC